MNDRDDRVFDSGWRMASTAAIGEAIRRDGAEGMRNMTIALGAMALCWDHGDLATIPLTGELRPALEALYDDGPQPSLITRDVPGVIA